MYHFFRVRFLHSQCHYLIVQDLKKNGKLHIPAETPVNNKIHFFCFCSGLAFQYVPLPLMGLHQTNLCHICHEKCLAKGLELKCRETRTHIQPPVMHVFFHPLSALCERLLKMSACLIDSCFTNWFPSLTDEEVFRLIAIGHLHLLSAFLEVCWHRVRRQRLWCRSAVSLMSYTLAVALFFLLTFVRFINRCWKHVVFFYCWNTFFFKMSVYNTILIALNCSQWQNYRYHSFSPCWLFLIWTELSLWVSLSAFSSQCCSVGIDYLRPEVSTVCAPYVFMCFSVSSIAACWEGRYLQRHCNRADTIACLALPWGELEVVLDTREEWKGRKK